MTRGFKHKTLIALSALIFIGGADLVSAARPSIDFPVVKLQSLDKITARTNTFEAKVGSTVKFGPLFIKIHACRKTSPLEQPEAAAFLQVWEIVKDTGTIAANSLSETAVQGKPQWVFSGWMFGSSPALSTMDHPVYDVWVIDCLNNQRPEKAKEELASDDIIEQPKVEEGQGTPGAIIREPL